jgi:predicted transcriptional regulator
MDREYKGFCRRALFHACPFAPSTLRESLIEEKLRIHIKDDLKVALTITDKNFSLGLFNHKGEYDYSMDLISLSKDSIGWGKKLFQIFVQGYLG